MGWQAKLLSLKLLRLLGIETEDNVRTKIMQNHIIYKRGKGVSF